MWRHGIVAGSAIRSAAYDRADSTGCAPLVRLSNNGGASPQESVRLGTYTQMFASPLPANPAQAKVIEGFREGQILWIKSDLAWHLISPVTDYVTGRARRDLVAAVTAGKERDRVPTGTDRFFQTRVTVMTGGTATIATCDDGSEFREKNPRTGQIDPLYTAKPDRAYIFETWRMVQRSGTGLLKTSPWPPFPIPGPLPASHDANPGTARQHGAALGVNNHPQGSATLVL